MALYEPLYPSTKGIDYYFEYAKAVQYHLPDLFAIDIILQPKVELPEDMRNEVKLTKQIRSLVTDSKFLEEGKDVEQVIAELVRLKTIDKDQVTSVEVAGVMRNLVEDETIEVLKKQGNKNIYIIKNQN